MQLQYESSENEMRSLEKLLYALPASALKIGFLIWTFCLIYLDVKTGPQIPFGLMYILTIYGGVKFTGLNFSYALATIASLGRAYVSLELYDATISVNVLTFWHFLNSFCMFAILCYLLERNMASKREAQIALRELIRVRIKATSTIEEKGSN